MFCSFFDYPRKNIRRLVIVLLVLWVASTASFAHAAPADDFVTTWQTTAANETITIPIRGTGSNFRVNWGDGTATTTHTSDASHTYVTPGTYTVRIVTDGGGESFSQIYFNGVGDKDKIMTIEQWGTNQWTDALGAFDGASNLVSNATDVPDLSMATDLGRMFQEATSFNGDAAFGTWDVSTIQTFASMFNGATAFNTNIDSWNVASGTIFSQMFEGASSFNQPLNSWTMTEAVATNNMFRSATSFNQPLNNWDVSGVQNMTTMFNNADSFNQPLPWTTTSVTNLSFMFDGADIFNQPLTTWNTSNVTTFRGMFRNADSFNQPLASWDVSSGEFFQNMFTGTDSFNQPLNSWVMSSSTRLDGMFQQTTVFNQPLAGWDVSGVVNMSRMFDRAAVFNQPLCGWQTGNVANMQSMFKDATDFDQDIGCWDMTGVSTLNDMFINNGLTTCTWDGILNGWAAQTLVSGLTLGLIGSNGDRTKHSSAAQTAYDTITGAPTSWTIVDGGGGGSCGPATPPDLVASSDSGTSTTDNVTNDDTPTFEVLCTAFPATTTVYTDNPAANTVVGTATCTALASTTVTAVAPMPSGAHTITYTMDDGGGESAHSPGLSILIDVTDPVPTPTVDTVTIGVDDPIVSLSVVETESGLLHYVIEYIEDNNAGGVATASTSTTTADSSIVLDLDPDEMVHSVLIRAVDVAGNSSEVVSIFPPVVTFTAGTAVSSTTINDVQFTVDALTDQPLTNITVGGPAAAGAALSCVGDGGDTTDPYDDVVTCTVTNITTSGALTVSAEDSSNGAIGQNASAYIIDAVPPIISFSNNVAAGPVTSDTVVFSISDATSPATTTYEYGFSSDAICDATDTYGNQASSTVSTLTFVDETRNGEYICVRASDEAGNTTYAGSANDLYIDTIAPNMPANLQAAAGTSTVALTWSPSIDNTGGSGQNQYFVYRDGTLVATVPTGQAYTDMAASPNTSYTYGVSAVDLIGNESASSTIAVTTDPLPGPGVIVSTTALSTSEGGSAVTYTLRLNTAPANTVTVTATAQGTEATSSPQSVTFSTTDWNTPQTITVTAIDDSAVDGTLNETFVHISASADLSYVGLTIPAVVVSVSDNDSNPSSGGGGGSRKSKATEDPVPKTTTVAQLKQRLVELQAQLADLLETAGGQASNGVAQVAPAQCPYFDEYRGVGDSGAEVEKIQQFLTETGHFTFGRVTGYFGSVTDQAVRSFQESHKETVLTPWGLTSPTGKWYKTTRKQANLLVGCPEGEVHLEGVGIYGGV